MAYDISTMQNPKSIHATISDLKDDDSDFEWYPTPDRMLNAIMDDIDLAITATRKAQFNYKISAILDVGAGDARFLKSFQKRFKDNRYVCYTTKYLAIEKAEQHVLGWQAEDHITFIGGDFYLTSLEEYKADIVFSNPPYSDYELWTNRLIDSAYCTVIYLVLPQRWKNSVLINNTLKQKNLIAEVIASDSFEQAERKARCSVDIVRVIGDEFSTNKYLNKHIDENAYLFSSLRDNPIDKWFSKTFPKLNALSKSGGGSASPTRETNQKVYEIFASTNRIDDLVKLYDEENEKLLKNYHALNELDISLFKGLNIDLSGIERRLIEQVEFIRNKYWRVFIHHYEPITNRLTKKYRDKLYERLLTYNNLSFNATNAYLITQMVLKMAVDYEKQQVIDFFYDLANVDAIQEYKSNQRVFAADFDQYSWRYLRPDEHTHFSLDYRIVGRHMFKASLHETQSFNRNAANYSQESMCFVDDRHFLEAVSNILIVARTVGFNIPLHLERFDFPRDRILTGQRISINCEVDGKKINVFDIKFFKNDNQHLFLNKEFAMRLNIYVGKELGWLGKRSDVAQEIQQDYMKPEKATELFDVVGGGSLLQDFAKNNLPQIGFGYSQDSNTPAVKDIADSESVNNTDNELTNKESGSTQSGQLELI